MGLVSLKEARGPFFNERHRGNMAHQEEGPHQGPDPYLGLLGIITVRNKWLLFKPNDVWWFVIVAWTDKDKNIEC